MSVLMILLSCAHRTPTNAPSLDGGWTNTQMGVFIGIEGAESAPEVWVVQLGDSDTWAALSPARQPDSTISFRLPKEAGPGATFSVSLADADSAALVLTYDIGREESTPLTRTTPRSRAALEGLIAAMEEAELEEQTVSNVRGLKTAEIAYHAAFDEYQSAAVWPRPVEALTPELVSWPEGSDFERLGWEPYGGEVRGTFQVEVSEDGSDFTIHGWQDLDGDGVPAHWTATRQGDVVLVSDPGVR